MKDIEELIGRCVSLGLDGVELLSEIDRETIKREYNGIGPEFFPVGLRDKVTEWLALFEPAALIHDLRNYRSDGMRHAFNYANMEFLASA